MLSGDLHSYNSLPLIEEICVAPAAYLDSLMEIAPLLEDNAISRDVGFALLHRHFFVDQGNVVVWRAEGVRIVSSIEAPRSQIHVPVLWRVLEGGTLIPLEYFDVQSISEDTRRQIQTRISSDALRALAKATTLNAANRIFAISLLPIVINEIIKKGVGSYPERVVAQESSDPGQQVSTIILSDTVRQGSIDTLWVLRPDRNIVVAGQCSGAGSHIHC